MKKTQRKINKKVIYKSRKHSNRKHISKSVKNSNRKIIKKRTVINSKQKGGDSKDVIIENVYNGVIGDIKPSDNFMIDDDNLGNISDYILSNIESQNNTEKKNTYNSIVNELITRIKKALNIEENPINNESNNVKQKRTHLAYIEKKLMLKYNTQSLIQNLQLNINTKVDPIVKTIYNEFFLDGNNEIKEELNDDELEGINSYISIKISPVYINSIITKLTQKSEVLGKQLRKYIFPEGS